MALLTPQAVVRTGLNATYTAVNSTDTANPDEDLVLHVKTAGTSTTVTITDTSLTPAGNAATNQTVVITTPQDRFIYLPAATAQVSGIITIGYSATTSVTAALLRV